MKPIYCIGDDNSVDGHYLILLTMCVLRGHFLGIVAAKLTLKILT